MNISKAILSLIERPSVPQPYRNLAEVLAKSGRIEDAAAVEHLIDKRFSNVDSPHPNAQQR